MLYAGQNKIYGADRIKNYFRNLGSLNFNER